MLYEILLNNFAIIENLDLPLQKGMTVITGETGAGKSIIIDALELALGNRLDSKVMLTGQERTDINCCFDIKNNLQAKNWLREHELLNDDFECVLRRTITQDGRSRCFINGQPMTLQNLAELGSFLVYVNGQHQQHYLLKREQQRALLDEYAGHDTLVVTVNSLYQQWSDCNKKIAAIIEQSNTAQQRQEFLQYQLKEFEKVALKDNEVSELTEKHKQLANADYTLQHSITALNYLAENEGNNAIDFIQQALKALHGDKIPQTQLANCFSLLNSSLVQLQEARDDLQIYIEKIENNPASLEQIENRLAVIHDLARKHRVPAEQLVILQEQLQQELSALQHSDENLQELQTTLTTLEKNYFTAAEKLSTSRKKFSTLLNKLVTENMQLLGMKGGEFAIALQKEESKQPQANGLEKIEFLVSANPGMPLQTLQKVASGGELSRISLAIQVIIAKKVAIPTLIFDEVDVGIGGKTAEIVGKMLRELGQTAQIICITHQAQVAANAHQHLRVEKTTHKNKTKTMIEALAYEDRVQEVARMLGGIQITEQTRAVAQEMLEAGK